MSVDGQETYLITWVAVLMSFMFAWLTYQFIEQPIRKNKLSIVPIGASLGVVAILGVVTAYFEGLPNRFPEDFRLIVSNTNSKPGYFGYHHPPPIGSDGNSDGPLVVTWGDSHADHLQAGLERLQNERDFRRVRCSWDEIGRNGRAPSQRGKDLINSLKPDVVIVSAFWWQYENRQELLTNALQYLQKIGIKHVVLVGPSPFWTDVPPRIRLYTAYKNHISHSLPERLVGENPDDANVENEIRALAKRFNVVYISPRELFCNEQGCLARVNTSPRELIQADLSHYTAEGSWFLINHFANSILLS